MLASLVSLDVSPRDGYGERFPGWFRDAFVAALPGTTRDSPDDILLAAIARVPGEPQRVTWEDRVYFVDPAAAELRRLRRVRDLQGGASLDTAISDTASLARALMAIVYAVHLGDPDGAAAMALGAARHDFGLTAGGSGVAWSLPAEDVDRRRAWHIRGSLLGLEVALAPLALRRVNTTEMPLEPSVGPQDRQTMTLAVTLMHPAATTDASRDAIVTAIQRQAARARPAPLAGGR